MSKIAYFVLTESEVHLGVSEHDSFRWIDKLAFTSKADYYYKEQLQAFIEKHQLQEDAYEEYILMWYSPTSSLIPMSLLENATPKEVLNYSFSEGKIEHEVDYNRISELSIINVYEIPFWVKSFFVIRFPRIVLQHLGTGLIRGIFNTSSFKPTIHLILTHQFSLMIYVKHNELKLYNSFEYTNESDLIYYTLNALNQTNSLEDKGMVILHPLSQSSINEAQFLEDWSKIKETKNFNVEVQPIQTLKYLLVCV